MEIAGEGGGDEGSVKHDDASSPRKETVAVVEYVVKRMQAQVFKEMAEMIRA